MNPVVAAPHGAPKFSERLLGHASLACLALLLVLPFQVWIKRPPVPTFHAEALAAALGLAAVTLGFPLWRPAGLPRATWLPLGFVVLLVAQIALGTVASADIALLAVLYLLWATALVVLLRVLCSLLGFEHVVLALAWALALGATVSATIGMAQSIEYYGVFGRFIVAPSKDRVWGNLAQPNHLADYLALGLASVAYLFARRRMSGVLATLLCALLAYVLVLTGSRAALLYIAGFVVLAAFQLWRSRDDEHRRLLGFSVLALATATVLPYVLEQWFPDILSLERTSLERLDDGEYSNEARMGLWGAAWRMFMETPLLGQGFRQFAYRYFMLGPDLAPPHVPGFNDHAHNIVLHVGAEFGAIGLLVLFGATAAWLMRVARGGCTSSGWWLLAMGTVLALHSLLEYPLWYLFFVGTAAIVLGLGEAHALQSRRLAAMPPQGAMPAAAAGARPVRLAASAGSSRSAMALMLCACALGWFTWAQLVRDYRVLEGLSMFRERFVHARDLVDPQARDRLLEIRRTSLLAPFVDLALARTIQLDRDRLADKLAVNARAMRMFPVDDTVYRQAILLAMHGDPSGALAQWDRAAKAFPEYEAHARATLIRVRPLAGGGIDPLLQHSAPLQNAGGSPVLSIERN